MAKRTNAYTLIEAMIIVLILGTLAFIAIPRLHFSVLYRKQADATARKIVTDMRRVRLLAITNAANNSDGFALIRSDSTFKIEDLSDSSTVLNSTFTVDSSISCSGGTNFQFGPLGNLKAGSDSTLTVFSEGKNFIITIIAATGSIQCTED
jgi:type II secretory pathway pseudopilin PulG